MKLLSCLLLAFICSVYAGQSVPPSRNGKSPLQRPSDVQMGDMQLTPEQKFAIKNGLDVGVTGSGQSTIAAIKDVTKRWNNGIVPYVIDCSLKNMPTAIAAIKAAIAEWESKTCLRFVKPDGHKSILTFFRNTHCWSHVGDTGSTKLSVGPGCDFQNVMSHEIGHAVGFFHEHNRPDRDTYVKVIWPNIKKDEEITYKRWEDAFKKVKNTDNLGFKYDYESIMHYPWNAFSEDKKDTLKPRQKTTKEPYIQLSKGDAQQIARMYNCPTHQTRGRRDMEDEEENTSENMEIEIASDSRRRRATQCVDTDAGCPGWSSHCQTSAHVKKHCMKTCNQCKVSECVDTDSGCSGWTSHCKTSSHARKHCRKTCNMCNVVPVTIAPPTKGSTCTDKATNCASLKSSCTSDDVRRKCRMTCGMCEVPRPCKDEDAKLCKAWKKYCPNNKGVNAKCPITCNSCPHAKKKPLTGTELGVGVLCIDSDIQCPTWKKIGHCTPGSYPAAHCLLSCGLLKCDKKLPTPGGSCSSPLGLSLANKKPLPDSAFSSSPSFKTASGWRADAKNARLYLLDDKERKRIGAWCAKDGLNKSHIQVDLGRTRTVRYIATQGRDDAFERVKKYTVSYSRSGSLFKTIQRNGKDMVFDGNCDHFTPVLNRFPSKIYARYVRVHPIESNFPCLRMELYGC